MKIATVRAVAVVVDRGDYSIERSLGELKALAETTEIDIISEVVQQRASENPASYIGTGKLEELCVTVSELDADLVLVDDEISAAQMNKISESTGVEVKDRTGLILEIFARHADTSEGKLQVEIAQLKYRLTRLAGSRTSLSRLGGGIGTRGPGETKLETDRRTIRNRIINLEKKLKRVNDRRQVTSKRRKKSGLPIISFVGYTNVGKSSLINALSGSDLAAKNLLFVTLDPAVRTFKFENKKALLVDTVGFVERLPVHLVEAFKSTLSIMNESDLIIKVSDATDADWRNRLEITDKLIADMGATDIEQISVFNKCDLLNNDIQLPGIKVSAATGEGLERLCREMAKRLNAGRVKMKLTIPFEKTEEFHRMMSKGDIVSYEYTEGGIETVVEVEMKKQKY
ncbi:MAG: GTPase HflX [Ruminococcaceae bacterium]|nr:GTPase HflX [Oscillospiraceae bacterium]